MSFPNRISYEASTKNADGIKCSVEEWGEYLSDISYEDAWLKALELAKQKAEQKLANFITKIDKHDLLDGIKLTGPPGQDGQDGNDGNDGKDGKDGKDGQDGKDGKDGTSAHIPSILNVAELNICSIPTTMTLIGETGSGTWYPILGGQFCLSAPLIQSLSAGASLSVSLPPAYHIKTGQSVTNLNPLAPSTLAITIDANYVLTITTPEAITSTLQLILVWISDVPNN